MPQTRPKSELQARAILCRQKLNFPNETERLFLREYSIKGQGAKCFKIYEGQQTPKFEEELELFSWVRAWIKNKGYFGLLRVRGFGIILINYFLYENLVK